MLSDYDVANLYAGNGCPAAPPLPSFPIVACDKLADRFPLNPAFANGAAVLDAVGDWSGAMYGAAFYTAGPQPGMGAVSFNGSSGGYISLGTQPSIPGAISVAFWVYAPSSVDLTSMLYVTVGDFIIYSGDQSGTVYLRNWNGGASRTFATSTPVAPTADAWTHLAVTQDAALNVAIYKNGVLQMRVGMTSPMTTAAAPVFIGGGLNIDTCCDGYFGPREVGTNMLGGVAMSDVQFALGGSVLSDYDVANLYAGNGCPAPPPPSPPPPSPPLPPSPPSPPLPPSSPRPPHPPPPPKPPTPPPRPPRPPQPPPSPKPPHPPPPRPPHPPPSPPKPSPPSPPRPPHPPPSPMPPPHQPPPFVIPSPGRTPPPPSPWPPSSPPALPSSPPPGTPSAPFPPVSPSGIPYGPFDFAAPGNSSGFFSPLDGSYYTHADMVALMHQLLGEDVVVAIVPQDATNVHVWVFLVGEATLPYGAFEFNATGNSSGFFLSGELFLTQQGMISLVQQLLGEEVVVTFTPWDDGTSVLVQVNLANAPLPSPRAPPPNLPSPQPPAVPPPLTAQAAPTPPPHQPPPFAIPSPGRTPPPPSPWPPSSPPALPSSPPPGTPSAPFPPVSPSGIPYGPFDFAAPGNSSGFFSPLDGSYYTHADMVALMHQLLGEDVVVAIVPQDATNVHVWVFLVGEATLPYGAFEFNATGNSSGFFLSGELFLTQQGMISLVQQLLGEEVVVTFTPWDDGTSVLVQVNLANAPLPSPRAPPPNLPSPQPPAVPPPLTAQPLERRRALSRLLLSQQAAAKSEENPRVPSHAVDTPVVADVPQPETAAHPLPVAAPWRVLSCAPLGLLCGAVMLCIWGLVTLVHRRCVRDLANTTEGNALCLPRFSGSDKDGRLFFHGADLRSDAVLIPDVPFAPQSDGDVQLDGDAGNAP